MKPRLVLYHANCPDGFAAAWACWLKYGDKETEYRPVAYGDSVPEDIEDREIYIVDFSFPRNILESMHKKAKSLLILDHHKTAQDDLADLDYAIFDMDRSGCGVTWDYLFPDQERSWIIDYVEDRDLWRFKYENSKKVSALIQIWPRQFAFWKKQMTTMNVQEAMKFGEVAEATKEAYIESALQSVQIMNFAGYDNIPVVNAQSWASSDLMHAMLEKYDCKFAVCWHTLDNGKYKYGLRSKPNFDVSELAKQFGGGGHKQSAGFTLFQAIYL